MEQIVKAINGLEGVHLLAPQPGSDHPEISWGDSFFYYAPTGEVPTNVQPFTTIVTKDYPGDGASRLDETQGRRLNVNVDRETFVRLTGEDPGEITRSHDFAAVDVVVPHPVYGSVGWISIVEPAEATTGTAIQLVRDAHAAARARYDRRRNT